MGFLSGKRILITGLLSSRSIAYGIAQACKREGADLAFTYVGDRFRERITEFAAEFGSTLVFPAMSATTRRSTRCSPTSRALGRLRRPGALRSALRRAKRSPATSSTACRARTSASRTTSPPTASLRMAKAALPLMQGRQSALLTLTYLGSERALPNYNTMGLAKAALEASVRYLAESSGPRALRVNGISAGPIKTLAASGIKGFGKILDYVEATAPLRRNVTIEEVGNVAAFLLSDLARA